LEERRDYYPGALSHGQKQKLALAAVLALGTNYLILDEPTTGLDLRSRAELGRLLKRLQEEKGVGALIASHEEDFISQYADRELIMT
jgi:energy-coupling factor transporter ATP-binding protein EcfA2